MLALRRFSAGWAVIFLIAFGLLGMALTDLSVSSVTFRTAGSDESAQPMPAPYFRGLVPMKTQEVVVDINYRGYGNTLVHLTPYDCFDPHYSLNGVSYVIEDTATLCKQVTIDLSPGLKTGSNVLMLQVKVEDNAPSWRWSIIGLAIGSPFLSGGILHGFFVLLIVNVTLICLWQFLSRQGWEWPGRVIFILACLLYLQALAFLPSFPNSNDIAGHIDYIRFAAGHTFTPFDYQGYESWNPPLYYVICASIAKLCSFIGTFDGWMGIRLFAVLCQMVFVYYALSCCRLFLSGMVFYTAACVLAFWPSALVAYSTWINNDIFLHPLYAAGFYYLLRWYDENKPVLLSRMLVACGLALMAKSSSIVLGGIIGICFLLNYARKKVGFGMLFHRKILPGWLMLAVSFILMAAKSIHAASKADPQASTSITDFIFGQNNPTSAIAASAVLVPDLSSLMEHPFNDGYGSLWDFLLKTMLFTGMAWQHPLIGGCLHMLFLFMMAYMLVFIVTLPSRRFILLAPLLVGIILPFSFSLGFTYATQAWTGIDFRYIRPALIALVTVYMLAVAHTKVKGWTFLYVAGNLAGLLFAGLSIAFFEGQLAGN